MSGKRNVLFVACGLALCLVLAGLLSPLASSFPDGLEWVAGKLGFEQAASDESVWAASPAPDYAVPGVENEGAATRLAGVAGTVAVFSLAVGGAWALSRRRRVS